MNKISYLISYLLKLIAVIFSFIFSLLKRIFLFIHKRKALSIPFYCLLFFIIYIAFLVQISGDSNFSKKLSNKRINDITQINPIHVNKIIKPKSINEIKQAIINTTGAISIGGGKFSMGGQTAFDNSLHIDMRSYNKVIKLDTLNKQVTVEPGITWRDLQTVIDSHDLSIKIMQTYANFTIGGSISVNCHGRYIGHGPIISSVLSLKIITASGELITANRSENYDVFKAIVGGYGGIGVIVEATLQLVDNVKVERQIKKLNINNYNTFFNKNIKNNKNIIFQNGDLYPPNYDEIINISWKKTSKPLTDNQRITPKDENYWLEHNMEEIVSWGSTGKWIRKNMIDPLIYRSEKVVWRNNEASYNVQELEPSSREKETYVLQEYFIPVNNIKSFILKMKSIYKRHNVNVINVSLRHALPDNESYLSWANEEVFAFVIYYQQNTDKKAKEEVKAWTQEMTDAIISEKGTWYLPYQPHATLAQFNSGYPNSNKYFKLKNKIDSTHRFTNKLLDKYNPYIKEKLYKKKKHIKGYIRAEEQTILTIPEWYLVFNPKEYADYLEGGKNPSDFPYYKSIDEYWKLYDKSLTLTSDAYPENSEYKTMLQVIGISITMEYGLKILYENTIGRIFSLFTEEKKSSNENVIAEAQRAYSDFIYHTAWYEFQFFPWVNKVWKNTTKDTQSSFLRKWERTILFTFEFSFKAVYAQLIEWVANSSYETPENNIYAYVSSSTSLPNSNHLKTIYTQGNDKVISITRWNEFTKTMNKISSLNIDINDISGNDEIAVSLIMNSSNIENFFNDKLLYESAIVTNSKLKRMVYLIPVNELLSFIREAKDHDFHLEHIYDY